MNNFSKQQGFTLVELLISTSIGLLLAFAVSTLYLFNKSTYRIEEQLARLQNQGEFAHYFLLKELRMAGHQGCANNNQITITNWIQNPPDALINTDNVHGYDGGNGSFSPALSNAISGNPVSDSDVLTIHTTTPQTTLLNTDMTTPSTPLMLNNTTIEPGDVVLITNCAIADLFMASNGTNNNTITHNTDYNISNTLSIPYKINSEVLPYHFYAYYIQDTGRTNISNQPIYALVREDLQHQIDEITEGIERMQVSYLVDSDAIPGPNAYQNAQEVTDNNNWSNVVAVQISLLLSTIEEVTNAPKDYYFNGVTTTPIDRKLRRQWDVFINLRAQGASS